MNFFAKLKRRNVYKVVVACAIGGVFAAGAASADEITVVRNLLGPEGPLFIDGNLYYVGWVSNTLSKWDGKKSTVLNHAPRSEERRVGKECRSGWWRED